MGPSSSLGSCAHCFYLFFPFLHLLQLIKCLQAFTDHVLAFELKEFLLPLKAFNLGHVLLNKLESGLLFSPYTGLFSLEGLPLAYRNAFDVARRPLEDVFRIATRVLFVRNHALLISALTVRTWEHFKTSTLDARRKRLTFFTLPCKMCAHN